VASGALLWILTGALVVRVFFALATPPPEPVADERDYLAIAERLLEKGSQGNVFRPPGYPAFLAAGLELTGSRAGVRVVQAILSALPL
jgi:hypothetical protein